MTIRNQHWYNRNEQRSYPLDERATLVNAAGTQLPHNILVGMRLHFPSTLGQYPYIASIGVTPFRVSLTIEASDDMIGTNRSPVGAVGVSLDDFEEGRMYAIEPQVPGVGGWVAFGSAITAEVTYSGRFSGPLQSMIAPKAFRAYSQLPVTSLSKLDQSTRLTGIIRLSGSDPIEIVKSPRTIDAVMEDNVIVIQIVQRSGISAGFLTGEASVFSEFAGPCGIRPETNTCGDPAPLEFINTVGPDCNGNITIRFNGCAVVSSIVGECGAVLECGLGLSDVCITREAFNSEDPSNVDECAAEAAPMMFIPSATSMTALSSPPPPWSDNIHVTIADAGELPYTHDWGDEQANESFHTTTGQFGYEQDKSTIWLTTENPLALNKRNLTIWKGWDGQTSQRKVSTDFMLLKTGAVSHLNAGLVLNYLQRDGDPKSYYYLVQANYLRQRLEILRHGGLQLRDIGAQAFAPGLQYGQRYRLEAEIRRANAEDVFITARLLGLDDPRMNVTLGPHRARLYYPDIGWFGLHADRCYSKFTQFKVGLLDG